MNESAASTWATFARGGDRRRALGLFTRHLARGEELARRAADAEAALCDDRRLIRFFRAQARQEAAHRCLFEAAARALGAPPLSLRPDPFAEFDRLIARAASKRRLVEIVVGTQVVLEALGEALLARLETGLARCGAPFPEMRRRILEQEATHHAFGIQWIARETWACRADEASLRALAAPYVSLGDAMIGAGASAVAHFDLTTAQLRADFRARLPEWARLAA